MTSVIKTRVDDLDCSVDLPIGIKVISVVTLVIDPKAESHVERRLSELGQGAEKRSGTVAPTRHVPGRGFF